MIAMIIQVRIKRRLQNQLTSYKATMNYNSAFVLESKSTSVKVDTNIAYEPNPGAVDTRKNVAYESNAVAIDTKKNISYAIPKPSE